MDQNMNFVQMRRNTIHKIVGYLKESMGKDLEIDYENFIDSLMFETGMAKRTLLEYIKAALSQFPEAKWSKTGPKDDPPNRKVITWLKNT